MNAASPLPRHVPVTHELKIWPLYFALILAGKKSFELRRDDRGYQEGDMLWLREWHAAEGGYTGRAIVVEVTYVLRGGDFGLQRGYAVLSFQTILNEQAGAALERGGSHGPVS